MSILTNEKDFLNKIKDQEDNIVALNRVKIQDAEIGNAQIENGSITNAKIKDLAADKITTGTLDVDTRIVVNDGTHDRIIIGDIS